MSFIILSTGRAGSGYTAKLLTEAGIPTGHEVAYNLAGYKGGSFIGESSWLALPFVEEGVYPPETNIYHQVRHPLKVIGSLVNGEMQKYKEYLAFQQQYLPQRDDESYLDYCARFVLEWNKRIEDVTSIRWRVEDINFNVLWLISQAEGITLNRQSAHDALKFVPKTTNKHPDTKNISWSDISDDQTRVALKIQTKRYGYKLS